MNKFLTILVLLSLTACFGIKHGASGKVQRLYQEFFVGPGNMQVFIKPLEFRNKDLLLADFTYRDSVGFKSPVIFNFSIISDQRIQKLDSVSFVSVGRSSSGSPAKLMFTEPAGKRFLSRFTSTLKYSDLEIILAQENPGIKISGSKTEVYSAEAATQKKIRRLRSVLM